MKATQKGRDAVTALVFFVLVFGAMWLASALGYWLTGVQ